MAKAFPGIDAIMDLWSRLDLGLAGVWPSTAEAPRILQEKIAHMHHRLIGGLVVNALIAVTMTFVLPPGRAGRGGLLVWGATSILLGSWRLADALAFRGQPQDLARTLRERRHLIAGAAAQGLLWGVLGWWLFPTAPVDQLFLFLVMVGLAGGGMVFISPLFDAYALYLVSIMLPPSVHLLAGSLVLQKAAGGLGIVYILAMLFAGAKSSLWVGSALRAACENEDLVARLKAANTGLEDHKARLEQVVEERTRRLSSAIAQLQEGLQEKEQERLRAAQSDSSHIALLQFNHQIISSAHEGIVVYGLDGRYKLWNPFMEAMTGVAQEELLGKLPAEVFTFLENAGILGGFQKGLRGESVVIPAFPWHVPATGRSGWATAVQAPMKGSDGEIIGVVETVSDITEWKRVEALQHKLEGELHHAQKLESIGSLAGGVAHDMNNVLGAIQAMVQTLCQKHAADPRLLSDLGIIERASIRGRDLVKGLTKFVRKDLEEPELLDLNGLVREEVELLGRTTLQKVVLVMALEDDLPLVMGERGALGGMLMNLCVNALDAMASQGVLTLRTSRLEDGQIELTVEDTGKGMPPEVMARAMEPFYTTKAIGKGTGLGLAMAYATVKSHGGTVSIQSAVGRGTRVLIRLPAVASATEPAASKALPAGLPGSIRILQVDDDELILAAIPLMLEHHGHTVFTASGGQQALDRLAEGLQVDLVILDLNMPGMNGLETMQQVRVLRPSLPVILATGYLDPATEAVLRQSGRALSISKPFSMEELNAVFRKVAAME